jgi:hypothetical protein
MEQEPGPQHF